MDVRKWLHSKILFDVDGMAHREQVDLLVPAITKLVEALRQINSEIHGGQNVPSLKAMDMVHDALAELEKP